MGKVQLRIRVAVTLAVDSKERMYDLEVVYLSSRARMGLLKRTTYKHHNTVF